MTAPRPARLALALLLAAAAALACGGDGATTPDGSPLDGLTRVDANDSSTTPPPQGEPTPGSFHGNVLGYEPGPGSDTLATAERLANVRVTAYPRVESRTDTVGVGPAAASVLTNANGEFQLPTLAGGEYVVTFNPPAGSRYVGGWTVATAHSGSNERPWWIMLPAR